MSWPRKPIFLANERRVQNCGFCTNGIQIVERSGDDTTVRMAKHEEMEEGEETSHGRER